MNGVVFVICSALIYGVEPSVRELALQTGVTAQESTAVSSLSYLVLSALLCLLRRKSLRMPFRQAALLFVVGVIGTAVTSTLLAAAYGYIAVGSATVIHFTYPTLVYLTTVILFKEKLTLPHVLAVVCSITGLLCITGGGSVSMTGVVLALLSGITYTFYIIMLDRSPASRVELEPRMFYITLGCAVACGLFGQAGPASGALDAGNVLTLLGCGAMGFTAALCFAAGVDRVGGTVASFFSLFEPLTSMIVSTILYHYRFTWVMLLGCVLSLTAIVLVSLGDHKSSSVSEERS